MRKLNDLFTYVSGLLGDMPGLSWFKYIIVGVILCILLDIILTAVIGAIYSLLGGKS